MTETHLTENAKQNKHENKAKHPIRLYATTTLVLWKSICDDLQKKKDEEGTNKERLKLEEDTTKDKLEAGISLSIDIDTENERIANERKLLIKKVGDIPTYKTLYKKYDDTMENFQENIKSIKTELTELYDTCDSKIKDITTKNTNNTKEQAKLKALINLNLIEGRKLFGEGEILNKEKCRNNKFF